RPWPGSSAARSESQKSPAKAFLEDLKNLQVGDYVVHVEHGVGKYQGLHHKTVGESASARGGVRGEAPMQIDLILVEYAGGDKLYLPVHRLNQLQKFQGGEGAPKLDRLGGQTF